ncbi:MAG: DUF63 family protein [Candidatus Diapherotrites archaeon]
MIDIILGFVNEYFIQPMTDASVSGYNPVNTITYGIILLVVAFYGIYPFFNRRGVKFDWHFLQSLLPYILFGISLRVLEDQHILIRSANPLDAGFYIFTPGIWILTFFLVMIGYVLSLFLYSKKGIPPHQTITIIGIIFALPVFGLMLMEATEWKGTLIILALTGGIFFLVERAARWKKWDFFNHPLVKTAFVGQLLDTSATFTALEFFSCGEQHVLPRLLFGAFGNISFFFVKIPLVLAFLYLLDKEYKEKNANLYGFILLFIAILGLATGGRDLLTVLAGTCSN